MATAERTLPIRWDLTGEDAIKQGGDWHRYHSFDYLNTSTGEVEVWGMTGYTARMVIRADYDGPIILELTTENGRIELGSGTWSIHLHLTPAATARGTTAGSALETMGLGVYDCVVTDEFGRDEPVLEGRVALSRSTL